MAGFFGLFDYTKEGPGVPKDAPPKSRFVIFFEVLARKFWNIVKVNLMFLIFNIPALIFFLFFSMYFLELLLQAGVFTVENEEIVMYLLGVAVPFLITLVYLPLITVGPAQAGMTYILRNYSREEHAFLWSDFIEQAKKNFKQSMIVGLVNCLVTVLALVDIYLYFNLKTDNLLLTIASSFIIMAFLLFMMMSMYIYPMMVTFKLSVKQLYKNAFLFAIMKFIPNLLILILCILIIFLPFYFSPLIGYVLMFFISFGLISYITNFYVYPKLDKYMIKPAENAEGNESDVYDENNGNEDFENGEEQGRIQNADNTEEDTNKEDYDI